MRRIGWLLMMVCLLAVLGTAGAEEVFEIRADRLDTGRLAEERYVRENLTAATQYIRVSCQLGETPAPVRLRVARQRDGQVVHDKNYGQRAGEFCSDEIYLKYAGSETVEYTVTLTAGEQQWQFPFRRRLMTLSHNTACSWGVRIREAAPGVTRQWPMATVVDLRGPGCSVPLCASDRYVIGTVHITVNGDTLKVEVEPLHDIGLTIHSQKVYAITDPGTLTSLDKSALKHQVSFKPGNTLSISGDLGGSDGVILYLAMEVSYDPNGLETFDSGTPADQMRLWQQLQEASAVESVG